MLLDQEQEHAQQAGGEAAASLQAQQDTSDQQADFMQQSLHELGVSPVQRETPDARSQSLHELGVSPAKRKKPDPRAQSLGEIDSVVGHRAAAPAQRGVAPGPGVDSGAHEEDSEGGADGPELFGAGPAGGRKKTAKKKPDFRAVALTRPNGAAKVMLGSTHKQHYWIGHADQAPKGTQFIWTHTLAGPTAESDERLSGDVREGTTNDLTLRPLVPGQKTIKSQLHQQGPQGDRRTVVDDVVITTPSPKLQSAPVFESSSKDGSRRPVLDTFMHNESLLVIVQLGPFEGGADALKPKVEGSNLAFSSARQLGPEAFEIRLHPTQVGKAKGALRLPAYDIHSKDAPIVQFDLTVQQPGTQDDVGSRPADVDKVRDWLAEPIDKIFERRGNAIDNVYDQEKEKDPPPRTPWWKSLLKSAVMIAINSVTAGLGAKVANAIVSDADQKHLTTELVKVIFEQTMSTPAQAMAEAQLGGGDDTAGPAGSKEGSKGPRRSMGIMFRDAQNAGLGQEAIETKQRGLGTIENMVKRMEGEKRGSGFREALKLDAALKQQYETAEPTQYIETFQRWCSVMASNTLNNANSDQHRASTNLEKSVDVDKVVQKPGEPGFKPGGVVPGLDKTPGVLNLTLAENTRTTHLDDRGRKSHPLQVTSASIAGLQNQDFRSTIRDTPIAELRIPMVAKFTVGTRGIGNHNEGFVIGRNEAREYWASEQGDYLSVQTAIRMHVGGNVDIKQAAEHIIMQEIGHEKVEPKES